VLYFATLFDSNYLNKGLALYESMLKHIPSFKLFILCLDEVTYDYFTSAKNKNIHPIRLSDVESGDIELQVAKNNRSKVEYYFTLSPVLPLYIFYCFNEVGFITTLDADIYFFNSPRPIYDEFKDKSILITPHRFCRQLKSQEIYGLYNVSFQIFRNDLNGVECLKWWRSKCLEWCFDKLEGDRFADQKYLDDWSTRFNGVSILQNEGAGLAPWNIDNYKIFKRNGTTFSNQVPLIFYHFHFLKLLGKRWFTHGVDKYFSKMTNPVKNLIYHPYINALIDSMSKAKIENIDNSLRMNSIKVSNKKEIFRNHSTLYNIFKTYTIKIDLKLYFRYFNRLKKILNLFSHKLLNFVNKQN
jgi:hypothetical protein